MTVKLRPIQKADNPQIKKIIQNSLASYGLNIPGTAYFDPELDDMTAAYANSNQSYWVLVLGQEVIGGGGVGPHTVTSDGKRIAEMQKLYISKNYRGQGYARLLIEEIIHFAKDHYDTLYLETTTVLKVDKLYEHFGFQKLNEPIGQAAHGAMDLWYAMEL